MGRVLPRMASPAHSEFANSSPRDVLVRADGPRGFLRLSGLCLVETTMH